MGTFIGSKLLMVIRSDRDRLTQWHMGYRLKSLSASVRQLHLVFQLLRYTEVGYTPACITETKFGLTLILHACSLAAILLDLFYHSTKFRSYL